MQVTIWRVMLHRTSFWHWAGTARTAHPVRRLARGSPLVRRLRGQLTLRGCLPGASRSGPLPPIRRRGPPPPTPGAQRRPSSSSGATVAASRPPRHSKRPLPPSVALPPSPSLCERPLPPCVVTQAAPRRPDASAGASQPAPRAALQAPPRSFATHQVPLRCRRRRVARCAIAPMGGSGGEGR